MAEEIKSKTIEELKESSYKLTDKVLSDLEDGLRHDFTVEEACLNAGIRKDTFYNWLKLSDEFAEYIDRAKQYVAIAAKRNIAGAVTNDKSIEDSWKYLERRQKKLYSLRHELTGEEGDALKIKVKNYGDSDSTTTETERGITDLI